MLRAQPTLLMLALAAGGLAACGRSEIPVEPPPEPRPPAAMNEAEDPRDIHELIAQSPAASALRFEAYAYDCEGLEIAIRPGDRELTLVLPERSIVLPQVEAASGARYAKDDAGFWGKGIDSATLTLDGEDIPCRLNHRESPWVDAQARGAVFRGLGQEPGWHLEIHPERIVMVTQYGEQRTVLPNPGVVRDPELPLRRWHATTESASIAISVEDRACTDVMSGELFPATVSVNLDGRDYRGCGRDLE